MFRAARVRATFAATVVLVLAASGCEIIATFDRDKIPDDGGVDASYDVQYSPVDGAQPDAAAAEASADASVLPDATADGTSPLSDAGADGASLDASASDANAPDASASDASVADTGIADSNVPDTSVPDTSTGAEAGDDSGN